MDKSNQSLIAVAMLVVGVIAGGVVGFVAGSGGDDDAETTTSTAQVSQADRTDGVEVGGAVMVSTLDIVDNAANADNVTTVVGLVQDAGLVETLKSPGPFTVFGPNNDAFAAVPEATLNTIASDTDLLSTVLTYHVVPGTYTTADLRVMANNGMTLTTVQGGELSFSLVDGKVVVVDSVGQQVMIETADIISSNGVTHVIENVLLPVDPSTL